MKLVEGDSKVEGNYVDGTITLNVDQMHKRPGETVKGAILRVLSHEVTHSFEKTSETYTELWQFCYDYAAQQIGVDAVEARIEDIQKRYNKAGIDYSRTDAELEFVAQSCEQMLQNSDMLVELYKRSATLYQRFVDAINELFEKLKKIVSAVNENAKLMQGGMDQLQKLWDKCYAEASETIKNTALDKSGEVEYSAALDEDATVVDLSEENELKDRIGDLKGAKKYKVIRDYIIEKLGRNITFSDGQSAIIDNSDANHIAHDSADKKTAEISAVENLIQSAVAYAYDDNVEHNKFDYFKYYEATVKFGEESFHVYFNLGRGKYDGKFHFYDLTNKIRDTARRINGVGRPRGFLPENGISKDIVRNPSEKSNTSGKNFSGQASLALDDSSYLSLAEKFRDGSATEAETEQLQKAVEDAAREAMPDTKIVDKNGKSQK